MSDKKEVGKALVKLGLEIKQIGMKLVSEQEQPKPAEGYVDVESSEESVL